MAIGLWLTTETQSIVKNGYLSNIVHGTSLLNLSLLRQIERASDLLNLRDLVNLTF